MATSKSKKKKNTKTKKRVVKKAVPIKKAPKAPKVEKNDHLSLPLADIKKDLLGMIAFALVSVMFVLFLREKNVSLTDLLNIFSK